MSEHAKTHDVPKSIANPLTGEQLANSRVAIVHTCWNEDFVRQLTDTCAQTLQEEGLPKGNISIFRCPGSFELPLAAQVCPRFLWRTFLTVD